MMKDFQKLDTVSETMNALTKEGFTDDFQANEKSIQAVYSKKEYQPEDLKIVLTFRFEGKTDPADAVVLFAIVANDGVKGTLSMSYSSESNQNEQLIKQIKRLDYE